MKQLDLEDNRHVVYLLHVEAAGLPVHYVGITSPPRLASRMIEHTTGRGSKATRQMCQANAQWTLARLFFTNHKTDEKRLRHTRSFIKQCPICNGRPGIKSFRPTTLAHRPDAVPEYLPLLQALGLDDQPLSTNHEKRRGSKALPSFPTLGQK